MSVHVDLREKRRACADTLLRLYKEANAGHIGSSLSCLEILVFLHFVKMNEPDLLILSKGHAAAALYTVLAASGRLDPKLLQTYYQDGTLLAAHPPCNGKLQSIPFGTGSLGHGLSLAVGTAFSQRFTHKNFHVFAILSEGDCNEGSTWEAALFASHHNLENLTVIIDANGLQGFGPSNQVLDIEPQIGKWTSFGFTVVTADDGNDFLSLASAFTNLPSDSRPKCIIARTQKGFGVSFMQNELPWHYLPMSDAQYELALAETRAKNA